MDVRNWYLVTFLAPNGWKYELTGRAESTIEAVRLADDTLEYMERIGIHDSLEPDGISVKPPAWLHVERVSAKAASPGFGVVITDPEGNVTRK
jgi:hypothetical protein